MNRKIAAISLIMLTSFSGVTLSGCVESRNQESTGQYIDSSSTTTKVKSKLLRDDFVKGMPITVKTYKGVVELSGFVDSYEQKERAIALARSVPGVVSVRDALIVK